MKIIDWQYEIILGILEITVKSTVVLLYLSVY